MPNFILELLHLWECPRYYPKAELWLGLASSAVLYMASFLAAQSRGLGTASLVFPGFGRTLFPFYGEDGEAEKQDTQQAEVD